MSDMSAGTIEAQIESALDTIRPALQADGGDVRFLSIDDQGVVKVELEGACGGCPMSQMTLAFGIERALKDRVPAVKHVVTAGLGGMHHGCGDDDEDLLE